MRLQLIRNATLRLTFHGHELLVDPYFAPQHTRPSLIGANQPTNPLVPLPLSPEQILAGVELVLISHLHSDHFDPEAQRLLSRRLPIMCQPEDAGKISSKGFKQVLPLAETLQWQGISITRTPGQHGTGKVLGQMGGTSGFVLAAAGEPTVYIAGDTIWFAGAQATIQRHNPDIIVTHSSGAVWGDGVLIIMDAAQTVEVCRFAPNSRVIAIHLDSLDHGTVGRQELRRFALDAGISATQLLIPQDGESLELR